MKMEGERDVAFALPGIVGSMAISVRPSVLEEAARCLAPLPGVDLVAVNRGDVVGVVGADGEAEVRQLGSAPERYGYRALRGDPLELLALAPGAGTEREFDEAQLFALTRDAARPDPLRRLWRAFHEFARSQRRRFRLAGHVQFVRALVGQLQGFHFTRSQQRQLLKQRKAAPRAAFSFAKEPAP